MGTTESTLKSSSASTPGFFSSKAKAVDKGPFTDSEYALLLHTWRNATGGKGGKKETQTHTQGETITKQAFVSLFDVPSEKRFAVALFVVFVEMGKVRAATLAAIAAAEEAEHSSHHHHTHHTHTHTQTGVGVGVGVDGNGGAVKGQEEECLSFEDFFLGVCACTRASDRSIMQVVFKAFVVMVDLPVEEAKEGKEERGGQGDNGGHGKEQVLQSQIPIVNNSNGTNNNDRELPYTYLKEVLRVAYQCTILSNVPPPSPPPPPSSSSSPLPPPPKTAAATSTSTTTSSSSSSSSSPPDLTFPTSLFTHPLVREDSIPSTSSTSSFPSSFSTLSLATTATSSSMDTFTSTHTHTQPDFTHTEEEEDPVSFDEFYAWVTEMFPLLYQAYASFLYTRLFPSLPLPSSLRLLLPYLKEKSYVLPETITDTHTDTHTETHTHPYLFPFALSGGACQGTWTRLYASDENGLSFNRVCHHILGYRGPTLLLIREAPTHTHTPNIFGFFTASPWKESNSFYGSSECFLFRLSPSFLLARPRIGDTPTPTQTHTHTHSNNNTNYMYLNLKGFSLPHGLGVGGSVENGGGGTSFRFFLPESLETCVAGRRDGTFAYAPLASQKEYELDALEVWGVGGESVISTATAAQAGARELAAENIAKARKVDKSKFLESEFDKEMFLGKTFNTAQRDRSGRD